MWPSPVIVEVRCAGCGETLEVEHGLTEFACPDCGTAQALPPELMPRRPRRALPLSGRGASFAATPSRVSCGGCAAVLSVPHGHGHFACPLCGAELAASPSAAVSVITPPAAVPTTPSRPAQPTEVRVRPSSQSTHSGQILKPIRSELKHGQSTRPSFRLESFSSFGADIGTEIPVIRKLQNGPGNPSPHRDESHTESLNVTISSHGTQKYICAAGTESFRARKVHGEHPNQGFHASEAQGMPSMSVIHKDKAEGLPNDTGTIHSKQKTGHVVAPCIIEHEQIKSLNHVNDVQQAGEVPNNVVHADQAQLDFSTNATGSNSKSSKNSKGNQKRKNKTAMNSMNELPHLNRSKRLVKGSPDPIDPEAIQKVDASTNQSQSEAPRIERTSADPDPSSPVRYRFPYGGSDELDDVDTTTPPPLNHDAPQADQLRNILMYSPDTRWALPVPSSNSWHGHEILPRSFSGVDQLNRGHEEVHSYPSETQNQDMDCQLEQEACCDKNRLAHVRLKPQNENLSEGGRQKRNDFTCSSSNDGEHPKERTSSETSHKTSSSASCSRLADSLPFPAATVLPTTMSPASCENLPLNCRNPSLLHQQQPFPHHRQEVPCGDDLPGSVSNPSKKRRGRAPEKLMEPRKESDRPVLTPSGTENWSVHPPCPKVANTLSLLIKQNYPGTYLSVDTSKNSQPYEHVVYHWHQCPPDTKSTVLAEFLKRYKWQPGKEDECQKIFDRKAVRQLFNLFCYEKQSVRQELAGKKAKKSLVVPGACGMELEVDREDSEAHQGDEFVVPEHDDPLKWKPFVPRWMNPKWWEMLCDHWAKDDVMKISYQKRKNRNSGKHPCNTAASWSIQMHQQQGMDNVEKLGCDIDSPTQTPGGTGVSVDQKACETETEEVRGAMAASHPSQGQVGSSKRGRYCGAIGVSKTVQNELLSKSSPGCVSKRVPQPMLTKEQVKNMINQALQGLNEVWEKKFLSLERKIPTMSSSYMVPDGAKVSLGIAKRKQCLLSREDTLDSVDGEDSPSARDDGNNQDEEPSA